MTQETVIKIVDNEDLIRDKNSTAVLNTDLDALQSYRARRAALKSGSARLDKLEKDMDEIKSMLKLLVNREENK